MSAGPKKTKEIEFLVVGPPPEWLSEEAREIWRGIQAKHAIPAGAENIFAIYCYAVASVRELSAWLADDEDEGIVTGETKGGARYYQPHPKLKHLNEQMNMVHKFGKLLGLEKPPDAGSSPAKPDPLAAHKAAQAGLAEERVQ